MFKLPILSDFFVAADRNGQRPRQPFSPTTQGKQSRLQGAIKTESVCPYCAVGCATNIYTKDGVVIDIEGNPNSPINEGTLCPKGANTFQLHHNPHRVKHVMWRAPYSDKWEQKPLEWAVNRIADLTKQARDEGYRELNEKGERVNHVKNIGTLGGATLDNEENYLIKKLFGAGLGVVPIENQARI
jgi:formate dehydrogenase major subunit